MPIDDDQPKKKEERVLHVIAVARQKGKQAVLPRPALLPELAMAAVEAAAAGEIDKDDAQRLYLAYYDAGIKRSVSQAATSHKVQVSKLRQLILLGEAYPKEAVALLVRVTKIQREVLVDGAKCLALYPAMIACARYRMEKARRALTGAQILKIIKG